MSAIWTSPDNVTITLDDLREVEGRSLKGYEVTLTMENDENGNRSHVIPPVVRRPDGTEVDVQAVLRRKREERDGR